MGKVRYNVVNGRVLSETRNGVQRDYKTDATGNTLSLRDKARSIPPRLRTPRNIYDGALAHIFVNQSGNREPVHISAP